MRDASSELRARSRAQLYGALDEDSIAREEFEALYASAFETGRVIAGGGRSITCPRTAR